MNKGMGLDNVPRTTMTMMKSMQGFHRRLLLEELVDSRKAKQTFMEHGSRVTFLAKDGKKHSKKVRPIMASSFPVVLAELIIYEKMHEIVEKKIGNMN